MGKVVITVRGEAEMRIAPEVAIVELTVQNDGPSRHTVMENVSSRAEGVRELLENLSSSGAVSAWSSDQISVWSARPWNEEGRQLDLVHYASILFRATFMDTSELSAWVTSLANQEGIQIESVVWNLTPTTRATAETEVAVKAVSVASNRASAYASALGKNNVTPVQVADTGLLAGTPLSDISSPMAARGEFFGAAAATKSVDLHLTPGPIVVSAQVEARFEAE